MKSDNGLQKSVKHLDVVYTLGNSLKYVQDNWINIAKHANENAKYIVFSKSSKFWFA